MDKISFHSEEIMHVNYSAQLEKVFSYDKSQKTIIWNINTLEVTQILLFDNPITAIFPFAKETKVLALGSESFLLEKEGLSECLGEFILWDIVYDQTIKRFIVITNHDVRIIDYLDGSLQKLFVHNRKDLINDTKYFSVVNSRNNLYMFLAMNNSSQFSLFNCKTLEKIKNVHGIDKNKKQVPTAFYFISDLELLAVGYSDSKIKGNL